MNNSYTYESTVTFDAVDRDQCLLLKALLGLMQEAAVRHADQHGVGAHAMQERGESWVLNRMLVEILRYPRYEEPVRVHTWSTGIRSFKGYRDFRLYSGSELIAQGSSFWLYINMAKRAIIRVPTEVAASFPSRPEEAFEPALDRMDWPEPPMSSPRIELGLRYSDIDANDHVNNTAYFELLQTALTRCSCPPRPKKLGIQFLKEISPASPVVHAMLGEEADGRSFALLSGDTLHARGRIWS